MRTDLKNRIIVFILPVILVDLIIGFALCASRPFSHLAVWDIIESGKKDDFYWPPENAPGYFRFEPDNGKTSIFRNEIYPLVKDESDEFNAVVKVAKYAKSVCSKYAQPGRPLKWGSPEGLLRQIRQGARLNCFHQSIIFSAYLSSLGIKSRLWALENEKFNNPVHTVNEVYIGSLKKWVFMDVTWGFYAAENGNPLSFLEFREKLLDGIKTISARSIVDGARQEKWNPAFYGKLVKCVFLRTRNDFVNKYNSRYGVLSAFNKYIDAAPDNFRLGLEYLLGKQNIFIHYVDKFSPSLDPERVIVKSLFYFLILSSALMGFSFLIFCLAFLTRLLLTKRSRSDTLYK